LVVFYFLAVLPLTWPQQAVCGLLTLLMSLALARSSDSYLITLTLMMMSMFCTFRYGYWRLTQTVRFFQDPANHWGALDAFFIHEPGGWPRPTPSSFFFWDTFRPSGRCAARRWRCLSRKKNGRTSTSLFPPTTSRWTWCATRRWARSTSTGRQTSCTSIFWTTGGAGSLSSSPSRPGSATGSRSDNAHAKAGNINAALKTISSPYVAIFDCDHVPTRSFLQMTVGWMLRDRKLAMLQTPHHFYSPDPFERNLKQFHG
jgi:cellulose synthase (UDP-forming)